MKTKLQRRLSTEQIPGLRAFSFLCLNVTDNKKADGGTYIDRGGVDAPLPLINNNNQNQKRWEQQ